MRASTGHSLPAELERSAPRDVALTTGGRALILLAWLLAAGALGGGAALHVEAGRQSDEALAFDRRSVTASAVVDRLWRKSGDGEPAFAALHFEANGARLYVANVSTNSVTIIDTATNTVTSSVPVRR